MSKWFLAPALYMSVTNLVGPPAPVQRAPAMTIALGSGSLVNSYRWTRPFHLVAWLAAKAAAVVGLIGPVVPKRMRIGSRPRARTPLTTVSTWAWFAVVESKRTSFAPTCWIWSSSNFWSAALRVRILYPVAIPNRGTEPNDGGCGGGAAFVTVTDDNAATLDPPV